MGKAESKTVGGSAGESRSRGRANGDGAVGRERHIVRGVIAGMIGGLVASWVMNEFMSSVGKKLQQSVQTDKQNETDRAQEQASKDQPQEDATMKAADLVVSGVTGGRHLTWAQKERGGPIVHYAFGTLMGGLYGGLAEVAPWVTARAGVRFGTALFTAADLFAVPFLGLSKSATAQPASKLTSPLAAHLVYGVTTEMVRRVLR